MTPSRLGQNGNWNWIASSLPRKVIHKYVERPPPTYGSGTTHLFLCPNSSCSIFNEHDNKLLIIVILVELLKKKPEIIQPNFNGDKKYYIL